MSPVKLNAFLVRKGAKGDAGVRAKGKAQHSHPEIFIEPDTRLCGDANAHKSPPTQDLAHCTKSTRRISMSASPSMPNPNASVLNTPTALQERQSALETQLVDFLKKVPNHTVDETNRIIVQMVSKV